MPAKGQTPGKDRRIMIYITGDTHGRFERVERFCERFGTSREDILIILGDAGINFSGGRMNSLRRKSKRMWSGNWMSWGGRWMLF